jgi:hypothetical protein
MWKETPTLPPTRPPAVPHPLNEDEFGSILDRLEAIQRIIHENEELRNLLSTREAETKELRARNAEMEEMLRKFAPLLVNAGNALEMVAKREKPPTRIFT